MICGHAPSEAAQPLTRPDRWPSCQNNVHRVERSDIRLPVVICTSRNGLLPRPIESPRMPLIGVMQQFVRSAPLPDRHDPGIRNYFGFHGVAHRPATGASREQLDHHSDVQPTFGRPDSGKGSDPLLIWTVGFKAAVKHVGRNCRPFADILWQLPTPGPRARWLQPHRTVNSATHRARRKSN